jgi:ATP-dependent Lon protease
LKIEPKAFEKNGVHLHVPSGATPKDGPSAGVAMVAALTSLYTNRPVRPDTAMTGEITLSGSVLPIGGFKEKVLAARRAGIKRIIVPKHNMQDLEGLQPEVRADIEFISVETIGELLERIFENEKSGKRRQRQSKRQKTRSS